MIDQRHMARALQLARQGIFSTHPNPRVGCVIVKDGHIVGEGWHVRAGEPHAEVYALRQAGELARGATAYVTLEPCSHHGRTPPCADGLLNAGVARVVAAMQDPNPQVAGNGLKRLAEAGVVVSCGVLESEARELNAGFIKLMEQGLPRVRVKLAMSIDGRTAMANGESQWITGSAARSMVQRLRAESAAIITGADGVLHDGTRLTVRAAELALDEAQTALALSRAPLRVLVDGQRRVPNDAPFFQAGPALIATCTDQPLPADAEALLLEGEGGKVDLEALLRSLGKRGINDVLVEAGASLAGAFARAGLVDEYWLFMAPKLLGSSARPLLDWPMQSMAQAQDLEISEIRAVGCDWLIRATPRR